MYTMKIGPSALRVVVVIVGGNNMGEGQTAHINHTIKDTRNLRENSNWKKSQSRTKLHYYQRDYRGEEERTS